MSAAALPPDEAERMARLQELFVLDSVPEPVFDTIARLASDVCGVPIALISLVDADRQWFKANVGAPGVVETPRDIAFCAHAILDDTFFEVPDATRDARFEDNPLVTGETDIKFYGGAPLVLPGGERVGTLCVLDHQARQLEPAQVQMLESLAAIATQALTMRRDLLVKSLSVRGDYESSRASAAAEIEDLYQNAPCGYHSLDAQGRIVRINNTALEWLGCTREEVLRGMSMADFVRPDDLPRMRQALIQLVTNGTREDVEFDIIGKSGQLRHLASSASVLRDAKGAFLMTRTVTYDVTELHSAKEALRRLNAEQAVIINSDVIGIVRLKDRRIQWVNPGAERMLRYEPGELTGQPTRVLYPDDATHREWGAAAYPQLQVAKLMRMQMQLLCKDGDAIWVDFSATQLGDPSDEIIGFMIDITPLKRAEEIRLRALALEAENRQLAESSRAKGAFLAHMSHELRTPLNAVLGYTHLLQAGSVEPDSPRFAKYLSQIGASGKHLLDLIDKVLNFAKLESGKLELQPEPVQLRALLQDVLEMLRAERLVKRVEIVLEVDKGLGEVVVDELRLMQALSHCVSNAIRFSHDDGKVTVRARRDGAERFRIEVEDAGIGIKETDLPRLFSAFQQVSEGNTKTHAGAGLGLALTRRLVEAQGGSVGVTSRFGVGSVFHLVLPLAPDAPG